jgi:uncharacterized membrane protein YhaH (DUF805 family)
MNTGSPLQGTLTRPMDYRSLFMTPHGRLAPQPFARGFILLTGAMLVITVLKSVVSPALEILQYTLVFPYFCLFAKRLHDAGLSAWLWLAFLGGFGIVSLILSVIFLPALSPGAFEIQAETQKIMEAEGLSAGFESLSDRAPEYVRLASVTTVLSFLIASALTGLAAFRLRSDPRANPHGPPVST